MFETEEQKEERRRLLQALRNCEAGDAGNRVHIQKLRQRLSASFERFLEIHLQYARIMAQLDEDEELKSDVEWLAEGRIPELREIKISDCVVEGDFLKAIAKSKGVPVKG